MTLRIANDDIYILIIIQISRNNGIALTIFRAKCMGQLKPAVSPVQYNCIRLPNIGGHNIRQTVTIHVCNRHTSGIIRARSEHHWTPKPHATQSHQNLIGITIPVGHYQIHKAVTIHICYSHIQCTVFNGSK